MREALVMQIVEAVRSGRGELSENAQRAARRAQATLGGLSRRLRPEIKGDDLDEASEAMQPTLNRARQMMQSDAPVIVAGESGSGKTTLAKAIHAGGPRAKKPFVEVDCIGL